MSELYFWWWIHDFVSFIFICILYIIYICICKKVVSQQWVGQSVHCAEMLLMSSIGEACNWIRKKTIFWNTMYTVHIRYSSASNQYQKGKYCFYFLSPLCTRWNTFFYSSLFYPHQQNYSSYKDGNQYYLSCMCSGGYTWSGKSSDQTYLKMNELLCFKYKSSNQPTDGHEGS